VLSEYFTIKSLEEQLRKYSVSAPFNGVITDVYLNNLSFVNPGTKIIRIVETGNYEIPVAVPTNQLHLINIGTKCRIMSTNGDEKGEGLVVRVSEVINKTTQSVNVYVKPNSKNASKFYEGEYVLVKIDAQTSHTGLRIPLSAIDENQVFVYSNKDSLLRKRPIEILNENKNGAFISGLKNNEIVIIQEVLNFKDSTKYGIILK
jgi:RND family efflux transporter MFP subunit